MTDSEINEAVAMYACGWRRDGWAWIDADGYYIRAADNPMMVERDDPHLRPEWKRLSHSQIPAWNPVTSDADCRVMRDAIAKRRMVGRYNRELLRMLNGAYSGSTISPFKSQQIYPRQQCEAALRACNAWRK